MCYDVSALAEEWDPNSAFLLSIFDIFSCLPTSVPTTFGMHSEPRKDEPAPVNRTGERSGVKVLLAHEPEQPGECLVSLLQSKTGGFETRPRCVGAGLERAQMQALCTSVSPFSVIVPVNRTIETPTRALAFRKLASYLSRWKSKTGGMPPAWARFHRARLFLCRPRCR
jgi:hypothetical protein